MLTIAAGCITRFDLLFHFEGLDGFMDGWGRLFQYMTMMQGLLMQGPVEQFFMGSWYIGELLLVGGFMYGMMQYDEKLSVLVLFPLLFILSHYAISIGYVGDLWLKVGFFPFEFLRALCEMTLGALICFYYRRYEDAFLRRSCIIKPMGIVAFCLYVIILFPKRQFDTFSIYLLPWILVSCVIEDSWLNKVLNWTRGGLFSLIGRNSLFFLFAHGPVILGVKYICKMYGYPMEGAGYVASLLFAIVFFMFMLNCCSRWISGFSLKKDYA